MIGIYRKHMKMCKYLQEKLFLIDNHLKFNSTISMKV